MPRQLVLHAGYVEDFDEPRMLLADFFSALLRATVGTTVGTSDRLFEDRPEAEVRDGILEVGIEPLERAHVRVGDIFHREGDPFFPFAKRSYRMPELISIEDDEIAWLGDQLKMLGGFHRIILKQFADQFALRRSIDEPH